jgi:hypothetical protein
MGASSSAKPETRNSKPYSAFLERRLRTCFGPPLELVLRVRYSAAASERPKGLFICAPETECIGRGRRPMSYEFGCKVSIGTPVMAAREGSLCCTPRRWTAIRATTIGFSIRGGGYYR